MVRFAAAACAALFMAGCASAQVRLTIDRDNPIGTIEPEIYGQFLEHLGAQPYGSIWVGPDSDIPNTDGFRDDVFAALDALDIPVIRWPGGCYADLYHWRDGIGPRDERPMRLNVVWGGTPDPNGFGTHEFFDFAERLGAKTYLNVNLGTGTAGEAAEWLEYITALTGARADERAANGREAPWRVDYLSIGNETWGCGGHLTPEAYADLYALFASFAKTVGSQPVRIIAGSHDENIEYADALLEHPYIAELAEGISVHVYTLPTGDWGGKGKATGFPEEEWISTLQRTLRMDRVIADQLAMFEDHPALKDDFGLYVDEWGMWVDTEEGAPALYQQSTIRDGVVAALNFNIFHKYADGVKMTNIAQMVNVLQAMILTDGPDMVLTPTYHVYHMYKPFQGATSLPVTLDGVADYTLGEASVPAISASAALEADGTLIVALVNADAGEGYTVTFEAPGATAVSARQLTGEAMDSHNTFEEPDRVKPQTVAPRLSGGEVTVFLPARSVTVIEAD